MSDKIMNYYAGVFLHQLLAVAIGAMSGIALRLLNGPCNYTTVLGTNFEKLHSQINTYSLIIQVFIRLFFLSGCIIFPAILAFHIADYFSLPRDKWAGLVYLITAGVTYSASENL
jgi:hypothetical protein